MAVALKDRPVLNFQPPPGVTMATWDTGSGIVTDAFKPDQVPGASRPDRRRRCAGAVAAGGGATPADGTAGGAWRGRQQHWAGSISRAAFSQTRAGERCPPNPTP